MNQKGGANELGLITDKNTILFKDLDSDFLPAIASQFIIEKWPTHTCSSCYQLRHKFHIVISGRLKVFKTDENTGREFTLFLLGKNDFFDVITLIEDCSHKLYYESLEEVKMLSTPILVAVVKTIPGLNHQESKQLEVIHDLSNEEIANLIGSTKAVVNRHFQEFKHEGILKLGRKKMEVINLTLIIKKATNQ